MSTLITHVDDEQFDTQVVQSALPCLVDFWGEWCAPCNTIAPMLEEIAQLHVGPLKVVKMNIDHNQKTSRNYRVRSAPTLMLFKNGSVQAIQIGALSKAQLVQFVERTI